MRKSPGYEKIPFSHHPNGPRPSAAPCSARMYHGQKHFHSLWGHPSFRWRRADLVSGGGALAASYCAPLQTTEDRRTPRCSLAARGGESPFCRLPAARERHAKKWYPPWTRVWEAFVCEPVLPPWVEALCWCWKVAWSGVVCVVVCRQECAVSRWQGRAVRCVAPGAGECAFCVASGLSPVQIWRARCTRRAGRDPCVLLVFPARMAGTVLCGMGEEETGCDESRRHKHV